MPVLGHEYQTFELDSKMRVQLIRAKERAAVKLAHSTLETVTELSKSQNIASRIGEIITGRKVYPERRDSVLAFYEPNDAASEAGLEPTMAAYFSDAMGGILFTRTIRPGDEPIENRLGALQPRAIITEGGYYGFSVVAIDEDGNGVFPTMMTTDDREIFIDQVLETLTIISARSHVSQRQ